MNFHQIFNRGHFEVFCHLQTVLGVLWCFFKNVSIKGIHLQGIHGKDWKVQVSGNWLYSWTEWISIFRTLMENWWIHNSANKRSRWKKINYMGLSELMRMIIIFVTFCLNKKKSHKDSEAKNIQINFHCKVKELLQWRITGLNVNIMT